MFGLQEILIICAIVVGAIVIPRLVNPPRPAPKLVQSGKKLSGKGRLAIAASLIFPCVVAAFMRPWRNDPLGYAYIGFGPVILGWLTYWVLQGYRRK